MESRTTCNAQDATVVEDPEVMYKLASLAPSPVNIIITGLPVVVIVTVRLVTSTYEDEVVENVDALETC